MRKQVWLFGLGGGLLVTLLKWAEVRWLVMSHAFEIYAALVAALFAGLGLWLGRRWTRPAEAAAVAAAVAADAVPAGDGAAPASDGFVRDDAALQRSGLTAREFQIVTQIAEGLSTREIAGRLFVSENTVKTHVARVLDKLGARRRTQAVRHARALRLIP